MTTEPTESDHMDNEPVRDVPGQQLIFPRFEGGVYAGDAKQQMAEAHDFAMRQVWAALGVM